MIALTRLLESVALERAELIAWIESGWVRPARRDGEFLFDELDVARVRLIAELRRDCAIGEEALPVILSLLDQLYGTRHELALLCRAIAAQPETVRQAIKAALSTS